jgi:adenylylsulfate kinase-like enzyme
MTGMGSHYQPPTNPDLRLETGVETLDNCVRQVMALVAI